MDHFHGNGNKDESQDLSDQGEDEQLLFDGARRLRSSQSRICGLLPTIILIAVFLPASGFMYWLGYRHGSPVLPRLPTDVITKDTVKLELKLLDDEFEVELPENARFKGPPRPELDSAWEDLLRGLNIRVPSNVAARANFTSLELADGSGDMWASPAVYHQLHCLKTIRQYQYPEQYPENYEMMKPRPDGSISPHLDHCVENLRQTLTCQGDMALYRYGWREGRTRPSVTMKSPHVCVDWETLHGWAVDHSFSIYGGLLVHPALGPIDPDHFIDEEKELGLFDRR